MVLPASASLWQKRPLLQKILLWRVKAFNPDNLLEQFLPLAKIFYSRFMTLIYAALIIFGAIIILSNRLELSNQLSATFSLGSLPLLWFTIFIVTLIHELSHGFACKLHGGRVSEMGFLLLYLQPCFYANISDAYLFPEKSKRMSVTTAGIKSQIIVWALAAIVWRVTDFDVIFNQMAFIVIALSFVGVIFNLNPLLKLDGYYYLVDLWGIPNLRSKAFGWWKTQLTDFLSGHKPTISSSSTRQKEIDRIVASGRTGNGNSTRETSIFRWYGLAAILYSAAMLIFILYKITGFIFLQSGVFGLAILYAVVLYLILETMRKSGILKTVASENGAILRPRTWITLAIVVLGLAAMTLVIKLDLRISEDCLIYPIESLTLTSSEPGYVELTLDRGSGEKSSQRFSLSGQTTNVLSIYPIVKEGDLIKKGDLIALIRSPESESDLAESRANLDRAQSQLQILKEGPRPEEIAQTQDLIEQVQMKIRKSDATLSRSNELAAKEMIPKEKLEDDKTSNDVLKSELDFYMKQKRLLKQGARPEELAMAEADIRAIQAKIDRLEKHLAATNITSPIDGMVTSADMSKNILIVSRVDSVRVRIPVPEKEISPVRVGQPIKLKTRGYPGVTFAGVVTRISGQTETGGLQPIFVVTGEAHNSQMLMKPGMTGHAKIYCGKRPIYKIILWRVVRWFRVEFWSWF